MMPGSQIGYTRAGNFTKNAQGQVVTSSGYPLEPSITIPPNATSITISKDGIVSVATPGTSKLDQVGQIEIATFANNSGLKPIGESFALATPSSGDAIPAAPGTNGSGKLIQGSLESSNVNVVEELVSMIETQRAYEVNSKAIAAVDGMSKYLTQNV
jgi:flagellar basal-body rod protein FlgG